MVRSSGTVRVFVLVLFLFGLSSAAQSAPCQPAHQPNNDLASAEAVQAEFCRSGQTSGDSRDLFRWTMAPADAAMFWSISLEALPGQTGKIEFFEMLAGAQPSDLKGAPLRFSGAMAPGSNSLHIPPMIFRPGSYIIAVSGPNGTALYRLRASPAGALPPRTSAPIAAQRDTFQLSTVAADKQIEVPWQFSPAASDQRWTVSLQAPPGSPVPFHLLAPTGNEVALCSFQDAQGVERISAF